MSHPISRCCFTARGGWAILTNTFHDMLAWIQLDCGVLLNVKAHCLSLSLSLSPLFLCLYFWLNHQITVCLPSQVTVFAVSGWRAAWSFPKVCQLLFSTSGDKYQRIHKVKNGTDTKGVSCYSHSVISRRTCPGDSNLQSEIKWSYYFTP